jgi:hypothetical protein
MKIKFLLAAISLGASVSAQTGVPLTESTFTEIIRQADVVAASDKAVKPAVTNDLFKAPDMVRTGSSSRVEMTAPDKTITRIGANTVFTFEPGGRNIRMEKGSILFHAPAGVGGGTIKYQGTAAAVLGTTMICSVLTDGSFKILCLEGHVLVTLKNGATVTLNAGQMVIVPADGNEFGPLMTVNLGQLLAHLLLVVGFSDPLSSLPLIEAAIQGQNQEIFGGKLDDIVSLQTAFDGLDIIFRASDGLPTTTLSEPDLTREPVSQTQP